MGKVLSPYIWWKDSKIGYIEFIFQKCYLLVSLEILHDILSNNSCFNIANSVVLSYA